MEKKNIRDIAVKGKKVIVRVDYNVPIKSGAITDDTRIVKSLPTINYLLEAGAAVILMTHLGRPKGKPDQAFTVRPAAERLQQLLGKKVLFVPDCIGAAAEEAAARLRPGEILMLENLRFYAQEEKNEPEFSEKLAKLADIYVNDGFGVSHRAHASVDGITRFLPSVAGFLLEREINFLGKALEHPTRPFAAILGGAKVSDKIGVIASLLNKADKILIGGGMANTFLAALGYDMQKSLVESDKIGYAKELLAQAEKSGVEFLLPTDVVAADRFADGAARENCAADRIREGWMALDIGEKTCELFAAALKDARTIVWNGPMGVFEMDAFCAGTEKVAKAVAASAAVSIVGGGDSVAAIEKLGLAADITHISTGGGASLEYLEGKTLPGVAALDDLRRPLIAGNWKMHKTVSEAVALAEEIARLTAGVEAEIAIFPPFTALESVAEAIDGRHVGYGGQDLHYEDKGAFTGAVSGPMLSDIGCQYVLVGHSERRHIFGETDAISGDKVRAALRNGLTPVLCVGERETERAKGETAAVIERQLAAGLSALEKQAELPAMVAYEPVWAIGTGKTASPADADEVCGRIRAWIAANFGEKAARFARILYGGSVNEKNIKALMDTDNIDGVLVGGASLSAGGFAAIARYK
ncbi:MAG: triose-phosphate isomerase [Acidaminococcales bacterium]|jgi:triosephosphate isomerase|nr:triose-phosphate isomerase [Acidaminococcales bacterium]